MDQLSQETIDQIQFSLTLSDDEVEISSRILEEIHWKFLDEFDGSRHIGKAFRQGCRFSLAGGAWDC